jgi:predicted O-methyltransferase YrrM
MDLFFVFDRDDADPPKIVASSAAHLLDPEVTGAYNAIRTAVDAAKDPDIKYVLDRYTKIVISNQLYLWAILKFDIDDAHNILSDNFEKDFYITRIVSKGAGFMKVGPVGSVKDKYRNILYNSQSLALAARVAGLDKCARETALFRNKVRTIAYLFDFLELGGSFFLSVHGFCDDRVIELYYVLALMFRRCVIYNTTYVLCTDFDPRDVVSKRDIVSKADVLKLLDGRHSVSPKPHLSKFMDYIHANLAYHTRKFQTLLDRDEDGFLDITMNEAVNSIKHIAHADDLVGFMVQYNESILENLKRVVVEGRLTRVSSAINGAEGRFIREVLVKYKAVNCLEVGMAYGISAFYMLTNPAVRLVSVDPFQSTQWHNYGVKLLAEFGFDARHRLYAAKSYVALPQMLAEMGPGVFDFVFVDGFHTFDYTLLDFFYANLLTKVGGVVAIDDALHAGVAKCVRYINTNYTFYRRLASPPTVAVYLKVREDPRDWDYHRSF